MATKPIVESMVRGLAGMTGRKWFVRWHGRTKGWIMLENTPGYPQNQTGLMHKKELLEWARAYRLGWMDCARNRQPEITDSRRLLRSVADTILQGENVMVEKGRLTEKWWAELHGKCDQIIEHLGTIQEAITAAELKEDQDIPL